MFARLAAAAAPHSLGRRPKRPFYGPGTSRGRLTDLGETDQSAVADSHKDSAIHRRLRSSAPGQHGGGTRAQSSYHVWPESRCAILLTQDLPALPGSAPEHTDQAGQRRSKYRTTGISPIWFTNRLLSRQPAEASPMVQARKEITALTGLRGACASLIVIFHMNGSFFLGHWHPDALLSTIFTRGYLVVDVFFILSGFLITRSSLPSMSKNSLKVISEFLLRRIARVWPLHALVLLLSIGSPYCNTSRDVI